jgi:hypothetical protein
VDENEWNRAGGCMLMMIFFWAKTHVIEEIIEALLHARKRFILIV